MDQAQLLLETLRPRGGPSSGQLQQAWAVTAPDGLSRLVEFEGCDLWLARRLQQIGANRLDPAFRDWLLHRTRETAARNLLVDAEIDAVLRLLGEHGIPCVLLKGAARRAAIHLYPLADARATRDVDVLVPASCAGDAWRRLRLSGYELVSAHATPRPEHHHLPPLWHRSRVAVELHTSTGPGVASAEAWRRATNGAQAVEREAVSTRVPSATELLWHGLTHSLDTIPGGTRWPNAHRADGFRLRYLLDGVAVLASPGGVDWPAIGHRLNSSEPQDRSLAVAWLEAAGWLAGTVPPLAIPDHAKLLDLGATLRRRLAVLRHASVHGRLGTMLCWWTNRWCSRRGPSCDAGDATRAGDA